MSLAPDTAAPAVATTQRLEFHYLDGMRGLAALVVVLHHALLFTGSRGDAERDLPLIDAILSRGYLGVPVFIVLSGYVLMLPVVNRAFVSSTDPSMRLDLRRFIFRRARRILPPYYAALVISLGLIAAIPALRHPAGTQWDTKIPVHVGDVVTHALLVHDISPRWIGSINGPLWSVAVEWQIYFLMPLVILPLWRKLGPALTTGLLTGITLIPVAIGSGGFLHPWLVALFAAGMWAAQSTVAPNGAGYAGLGTAGLAVLALVTIVAEAVIDPVPFALTELTVGFAVACGLAWAGRRTLAGTVPYGLRPLASRPFMRLGLFSYSIYLLHSPLIALANLLLWPLGWSTLATWSILTFAVVPVVIAICYGFFWLVESRCLNSRQRHAVTELTQPEAR
jgi:peptidoglycan/LPS O-acetylase OafA/YrhL